MSWSAAAIAALSALWASFKAARAKKAAAELQPGQEINDAMKKDAAEIDQLADGAEAKP